MHNIFGLVKASQICICQVSMCLYLTAVFIILRTGTSSLLAGTTIRTIAAVQIQIQYCKNDSVLKETTLEIVLPYNFISNVGMISCNIICSFLVIVAQTLGF